MIRNNNIIITYARYSVYIMCMLTYMLATRNDVYNVIYRVIHMYQV